jgi:hypothetical protein
MKSLLIIAPHTAAVIAAQGSGNQFTDTYIVEISEPDMILHELAGYRINRGIGRVLIVEKGLSEMHVDWVWVGDAINRSGANPLRGISGDWPDPFLDLTKLYHVPLGTLSSTVTYLGDRSISPEITGPSCAYLHALAILAHRLNIAVSAVLINPHPNTFFDPGSSSFWELADALNSDQG